MRISWTPASLRAPFTRARVWRTLAANSSGLPKQAGVDSRHQAAPVPGVLLVLHGSSHQGAGQKLHHQREATALMVPAQSSSALYFWPLAAEEGTGSMRRLSQTWWIPNIKC